MSENENKATREWIFTFGDGSPHAGCCVRIAGKNFLDAREKMFAAYGEKWCGQYSIEEWEDWKARKPAWIPLEREIARIE